LQITGAPESSVEPQQKEGFVTSPESEMPLVKNLLIASQILSLGGMLVMKIGLLFAFH